MTAGPCRRVRPRRDVWGQDPHYPVWLAFLLAACLVCSPVQADENPPPDAELDAKFTCSLQPVWDDKGSGADLDGFFYLPNVGPTEYIIGGYGNRNKNLLASDCVLTLRDSAYLAAPAGWELVWKDKGSGAWLDGSMWRAVPPSEDYRCVGHVPQEGYDEPYVPNYRCVHASFTEKLVIDEVIWSDRGSGANTQVTMLRLPNSYSFAAVGARTGQLDAYDLRVDRSAPAGKVVVVQADKTASPASQVPDAEPADGESSGAPVPDSAGTETETETGQPLSEGDADTQADAADEQADLLRAVAEAALAAEDFDLAAEYLARLRALQSDSSTLAEGEQDPVAAREEPADEQAPEPPEQPVAQADPDEPPRVEKAIDDHPKAQAEHEAPFTTDLPEAGSEAPAQTIMDAPEKTNETPQPAERIDTARETARLTAAPEVEPAPEDTGLATEYPARARALPPDTPDVAVEQRRPAAAPQVPAEEQAPAPGGQTVVQADTGNVQPGDETPVQVERIETEAEPSNANETATQTDNRASEPTGGTSALPIADLVPDIDIKISEVIYPLIFLFIAAAVGYFLPGMKKKLWLLIAVLLLLLVYFGIKSYASNIAEKEIDKLLDKVSEFVNVNYQSVSVHLIGMDVSISDINITPGFNTEQNIAIDEIIIRDIDDKSEIPAFMSILIHGLELKIDEYEQFSGLEKLGYRDELSVDLGMEYDFADDELSVNDLFIGVDDLGEMSVDVRLGNLPIQRSGILNLLFSYPEILLYELQIELDVVPLVERYIEAGAEELDISESEFKSKAIEAIEQDIKNAGDTDNLLYISYLVMVKNYIDEPDELSISVSPTSSYQRLGQIQNLSFEELDNLNLRIE